MDKFKKISFVVVVMLFVFISMCPISAFATESIVTMFPFPEPHVSGTSGYIALKGSGHCLIYYQISPVYQSYDTYTDPLFVIDDIYGGYAFYYSVNGDEYTTYNMNVYVIDSLGNISWSDSSSFEGNVSDRVIYLDRDLNVSLIDCHGNIDFSHIESDYATFEYLFVEDKYEYLYLLSIVNVLTEYFELSGSDKELLQSILESNQSIESILSEVQIKFGQKLDLILLDNDDIRKNLASILQESTNSRRILENIYDEVVAYLSLIDSDLLEIWSCVDQLEGNTDMIESLLQQILDALNVKGESQYSEVDRSQLDQYYEDESRLMSRVDVSAAMNINIDQNALAFCWNTVENILNSNGKILTAVFVVLSVGIIALFLGR